MKGTHQLEGNVKGEETTLTGSKNPKPRRAVKTKSEKKEKTVVEAKRVAAQLRLMAGQLDRLADKILDHVNTSS